MSNSLVPDPSIIVNGSHESLYSGQSLSSCPDRPGKGPRVPEEETRPKMSLTFLELP